MAISIFSALRARLAAKWRKVKAAGANAAAVKVGKSVVTAIIALVAGIIVVGLAWLVIPRLPETWQGPLLAILQKGVPEGTLPKSARNITVHVGLGPRGYGDASDVFRAASKQGTTIVHLDSALSGAVLICHEWEGSGPDDAAILRAFVVQHAHCFEVTERDGGGFSIAPRAGVTGNGDVLRGADGSVLAYTCECREKLDAVRSAVSGLAH